MHDHERNPLKVFFVIVFLVVQTFFVILRTHERAPVHWAWSVVLLPSYVGLAFCTLYWCYALCYARATQDRLWLFLKGAVGLPLLWVFLAFVTRKLDDGEIDLLWEQVFLPLTVLLAAVAVFICSICTVCPNVGGGERGNRRHLNRGDKGLLATVVAALFVQSLLLGGALDRRDQVEAWSVLLIPSYFALAVYACRLVRDSHTLYRGDLRHAWTSNVAEVVAEGIVWLSLVIFIVLLAVHLDRGEDTVSLLAVLLSLIGLPLAWVIYAWCYHTRRQRQQAQHVEKVDASSDTENPSLLHKTSNDLRTNENHVKNEQ